ncbi:hypothetical protein [Spiroplasma sp. AdecLV25b]|uniref:hypothetical protein n=1 Tax=Spiroplasma sp. AdecLV25b TaxID=3027162 RepID=UPI0027DF551D|nr:hypothetical protein [Spiroplasma sp. AdecLV25b]
MTTIKKMNLDDSSESLKLYLNGIGNNMSLQLQTANLISFPTDTKQINNCDICSDTSKTVKIIRNTLNN